MQLKAYARFYMLDGTAKDSWALLQPVSGPIGEIIAKDFDKFHDQMREFVMRDHNLRKSQLSWGRAFIVIPGGKK